MLTDAQLVARCRAGDQPAWAALVERFARYVHAIAIGAYRLPEADAEDVFQDVFARAYEHLDRLRDDDAVRPWLAQLTRNACVDRLRSAPREEAMGEELEPPDVDETLAALDEALTVREALGRLSPDCAEILDRFFARDESYRAIGEVLGIPSGTIASRISRCLDRLRLEYEGRNPGGAPS